MELEPALVPSVHERRPIAVAMALSAAMHAAILALVVVDLGRPVTPNEQLQLRLSATLVSPGPDYDGAVSLTGAEETETPTALDRNAIATDAPAEQAGTARFAEPPGEGSTPPDPSLHPGENRVLELRTVRQSLG
ncbi:MAG TPA: hypothetical protein VF200_08130 [Woeseiaceae bacterium]